MLHGRLKIYTTETNFTEENILYEVEQALNVHLLNLAEEDYLYWYRRGVQPIENRHKDIRPEINNKICENHSQEIVTFKDGYFLCEPAFYKSRKEQKWVTRDIQVLNEHLFLSGKQSVDNEVVDWFHTVGLGVCYVEPTDGDELLKCYALDPRQAFVVYSRRPGSEPVMGINMVQNKRETLFDVFTRTDIWHLRGAGATIADINIPPVSMPTEILSVEPNLIGEIPIIEYQYDQNRMSAFESVITMLDALNNIESNAMDAVEQFVQSLMIFYNCELGTDEEGNEITPSYIRQSGAIFLKSIGQDKADLKILNEQLDQSQTQVLKQNLYEQILHIVGMPAPSNNSGSTGDNVGAVIWRSGWYQAETYARNTEDLFKKSNRYFDRVFLKILKTKSVKPLRVGLSDFELQINRNETTNILSKTQACMNMRELGFSPEIAFARTGITNDPVADIENSKKYIDMKWGNYADTRSDTDNRDSTFGEQEIGSEDRTGTAVDNRVRQEDDIIPR